MKYEFQGPKFVKTYDSDTSTYNKVYCDGDLQIYVFDHKTTEEASSANWEVFEQFCKSVSNTSIFDDSLCSQKFDPGVLINSTNKFISVCDVQEIIETEFDTSANFQLDRFMLHVEHRSFSINYELPLFFDRLSHAVMRHGYVVDRTLPRDSVTMYGKSQPDISIYRTGGGYIKKTTIVGAAIDICPLEGDVQVSGGTIEWKTVPVHQKRYRSQEVNQLMANMVRLGGFLASKAFEKGCLVDEINVYALLVSHTNPLCVPFRYRSKCSNNSTAIMKGDEVLLNDAIRSLFSSI